VRAGHLSTLWPRLWICFGFASSHFCSPVLTHTSLHSPALCVLSSSIAFPRASPLSRALQAHCSPTHPTALPMCFSIPLA
ncbi:hypothetical protein EDB83DRAFT_2364429, partial [Lactarius deliciosus]